jgi:hypothetical protein
METHAYLLGYITYSVICVYYFIILLTVRKQMSTIRLFLLVVDYANLIIANSMKSIQDLLNRGLPPSSVKKQV